MTRHVSVRPHHPSCYCLDFFSTSLFTFTICNSVRTTHVTWRFLCNNKNEVLCNISMAWFNILIEQNFMSVIPNCNPEIHIPLFGIITFNKRRVTLHLIDVLELWQRLYNLGVNLISETHICIFCHLVRI